MLCLRDVQGTIPAFVCTMRAVPLIGDLPNVS